MIFTCEVHGLIVSYCLRHIITQNNQYKPYRHTCHPKKKKFRFYMKRNIWQCYRILSVGLLMSIYWIRRDFSWHHCSISSTCHSVASYFVIFAFHEWPRRNGCHFLWQLIMNDKFVGHGFTWFSVLELFWCRWEICKINK